MKKRLTACVVTIILLGLAACAGGNDSWDAPAPASAPAPQRMHYSHTYGDFDLPLTGGGGLFGGIGRSSQNATTAQESAWVGAAPDAAPPANETGVRYEDLEWEDIAGTGQRHVIQSARVELDTEYFDETVEALRQLPESVHGFIESSMTTGGRWQRFTIVMRVPVASFDTVLAQVEALAYVRFSNQQAQDVTDQFYDMVGSYELRRLEEERILALIADATTVQELLALEQRLSNTRLSIETYLSQLNQMAGQVSYSTISVTLIDVSEVPVVNNDPTLVQRIGGAFGDSVDGTLNAVQNVVVFFAGAIIPLVLLGLAAFVVFKLMKVFRARVN